MLLRDIGPCLCPACVPDTLLSGRVRFELTGTFWEPEADGRTRQTAGQDMWSDWVPRNWTEQMNSVKLQVTLNNSMISASKQQFATLTTYLVFISSLETFDKWFIETFLRIYSCISTTWTPPVSTFNPRLMYKRILSNNNDKYSFIGKVIYRYCTLINICFHRNNHVLWAIYQTVM